MNDKLIRDTMSDLRSHLAGLPNWSPDVANLVARAEDHILEHISATKPVMSNRAGGILQAVHMEGYRDGVRTINQVACDDAHEEGRIKGLQEAKADRQWWGRFCFLCGVAASVMIYKLVLS